MRKATDMEIATQAREVTKYLAEEDVALEAYSAAVEARGAADKKLAHLIAQGVSEIEVATGLKR